jgi:glycosyltransferase involved in cell wall biosynthesis
VRVTVTVQRRNLKSPDGRVWTCGSDGYEFWKRYLEVFDGVVVVARVEDVDRVPEDHDEVLGPGVTLAPIPPFHGARELARRLPEVTRALLESFDERDAVIFRVPGYLSILPSVLLRTRGRPFGLEVIGDPYDVLAPGTVDSRLRPLLRHSFSRTLKWQCANAAAVSYVTARALQRRYPPGPATALATSYSSVVLPDEAFATAPRSFDEDRGQLRIVSVGSMEQPYKGFDTLIEALGRCVEGGLDATLEIAGDGRLRPEYERLAGQLGLERRVRFLGSLPGPAAVWERYRAADLFVLASRTEGLPRSIIEAMAQALPCLGTTAGGIPELLDPEDLFAPGDAEAAAMKMMGMASDPARMTGSSSRNLNRARSYADGELNRRRRLFYEAVERSQKAYLAASSRGGR